MEDFCSAKVTSKGQVTIPKQIRDLLNLSNGNKLIFNINKDGTVELINKDNCDINVKDENKKVNISKEV